MLGLLGGAVLVVIIGAAICYKFAEASTPPFSKKKVRVPDFDIGLNGPV